VFFSEHSVVRAGWGGNENVMKYREETGECKYKAPQDSGKLHLRQSQIQFLSGEGRGPYRRCLPDSSKPDSPKPDSPKL